MFKIIMMSLYCVLMAFVMWFPGFMMARNMVIACSDRKPDVGETILAIFPFINLSVGRKQLHGSAKLVWITFSVLVATIGLKAIFYFGFNNPLGVLMSTILTFILFGVILVSWFIQAYVLFDIASLLQCGTVVKILSFLVPPLTCYLIGRNCIPLMRAAYESMEEEEEEE